MSTMTLEHISRQMEILMESDEQLYKISQPILVTWKSIIDAHLRREVKVPDGWRAIETAPKDGSHILVCMVTPVYDEDTRETSDELNIVVAYWAFGAWMEYPASPRYIEGQRAMHWMPLPAAPTSVATDGQGGEG